MFHLFHKKKDSTPCYYFPFEHSIKYIQIQSDISYEDAKKIADDINYDPDVIFCYPCAKLISYNDRYSNQ